MLCVKVAEEIDDDISWRREAEEEHKDRQYTTKCLLRVSDKACCRCRIGYGWRGHIFPSRTLAARGSMSIGGTGPEILGGTWVHPTAPLTRLFSSLAHS